MHTVAANLRTIAELWPSLREQLAVTNTAPTTWPPAGRMSDYLAQLDAFDRQALEEETRQELADRTALAPGERVVPIRLSVLDTLTVCDVKLLHAADVTASSVQRPAMSMPTDLEGWLPDDIALRWRAVQADRDDKRRWRWTGPAEGRSGLMAALWLHARVIGSPGPFRPLYGQETAFVTQVARETVDLIERALGIATREDPIGRDCRCGGHLVMRHGGEQLPAVHCPDCGQQWEGAALVKLLPEAA